MNNNTTAYFSFFPSDYEAIKQYLDKKLEEGLRLKWVIGGFAGFEKNDLQNVRYVIDPYPNTNLLTTKRMERVRLNMYTENNWYFVGKIHGNYIFFTDAKTTEEPNLETKAKEKIISAELQRHSLFLVVILFAIYNGLNTPSFMYSLVLTDMYMYAAAILAFLGIISIASIFVFALQKVRLANKTFTVDYKKALNTGKIITVRDAVLIIMAFAFLINEIKDRPLMLVCIFVPIGAMIIAGIVLKKMVPKQEKEKSGQNTYKRITPVAYGFGAVIMLLIVASLVGIQKINTAYVAQKQAEAPQRVDSFGALRMSDFYETKSQYLMRENKSILADNILFTEEDEAKNNVFSNITISDSSRVKNIVFNYLYTQAQVDYEGEFEEIDLDADKAFKISNKNAYLLQRGNVIILTTVSDNVDEKDVLEKLIEKLQQN